ncbi:MAG: RNA-binding protein [Gammaproteobacteria bacterium CG_4_10_14_0_8_um_filter_38_16]|nr:MAG: RNA-binding protein [Gammaproteobacteria bacterium CG_4_10_14_0_8_um_filter_38_16]PJA02759.1 MAG: RNA-binding protein [Gammaproteobacteria bacterium CG_4_10_14_0_2_um_filter_38_22]PJB10417.1 MAG: RNA-binding protein [Gammaproteobacteria bacterium CG_4_9_14_3_um_filter_38_9]
MSQSKIYVGNLSYNTSEDELRDYFAQYGNIEDIKLIIDFNTGRSKGFGFITFSSDQDCENALAANGVDLGGRKLKVNIARDDNRRSAGAGGAPGRGARTGGGNNRPFRERGDRE